MQSKTLVLSLAAVAVLAVAAVSFAGPGYGPGRGGFGCPGPGYGAGPKLTEEQQAALAKAQEEHFAKIEAADQDLYTKNLELEAELSKAAPDTKKVAALTREINDLRGAIFAEQTAFRASLARDFGLRGAGAGCGFGPGAGAGSGRGVTGGFGPGDCPRRGGSNAPDAGAKAN